MIGVQQMQLTGENLVWDLMKFCKGYKPSEIEVHGIREGAQIETRLSNWEGDNKSEKIRALAGVLEIGFYEDVDIILPNCCSYVY